MKFGTYSISYSYKSGWTPGAQPRPAALGSLSPRAEMTRLAELYKQGHLDEVIARGEALAATHPSGFLYTLVGTANAGLNRLEQAIDCFQKALRLEPSTLAFHNLGAILRRLGRLGDAIACFEQGLAIDADCTELQNSLGEALTKAGRLDEALSCLERAVAISPDFAEARKNLGSVLLQLGRSDEAIACQQAALVAKPDDVEGHYDLGCLLAVDRRRDEAIACFERALAIDPGFARARSWKLYQQAAIGNWDAIRAEAALIPALGLDGQYVAPFSMLTLEDAPERHRIRAEKFTAQAIAKCEPTEFVRPSQVPRRLRIGYFSADFHNHATLFLMVKLFELHDTNRFEIYAYSYGSDSEDDKRQRVKDAVQLFRDVRSMDDDAVAALARRDRLDIAIDLKGHTQGARLGIFAWRAAPVQISYLGYPGTLGAPFIDYIVADRIVIPEEMRQHYSENVIYLPDTYQVTDNGRLVSERAFARAELGLPDDGFVFCCFNDSYKVTPAEFDIWMPLLDRVEGSVLWLFRANRWVEDNLRKEAQRHGIDPDRLVFAERTKQSEHLARQRLADLFLDTFNVNAHTTASDALWVGLPVVTKLGKGFAARVAASLLTAVGLPELVTTTSEDYAALALELATNPAKLAAIKAKLAANRLTTPLFDSEGFARHIESAYEQAYLHYVDSDAPRDIIVSC